MQVYFENSSCMTYIYLVGTNGEDMRLWGTIHWIKILLCWN